MYPKQKIHKRRTILILALLFILFPLAFFITNPDFYTRWNAPTVTQPASGASPAEDPLLSLQQTEIPVTTSHNDLSSPPAAQDVSASNPILAMRDGDHIHLFLYEPDTTALYRLSGRESDDIQPVFSPDGAKLAFSSNRSGFWDIYVLDLTSQELINVTHSPEYDASPSWSPDGQWLVFESYTGNDLDVKIISVEDEDAGAISLTDAETNDHSPVWAPEGRSILFVSDRSGDDEIWLADLDSSDDRFVNISNRPASQDREPDWSPDGEQVIWASSTDGVTEIVQLSLQSMQQESIGVGHLPVYSPDGSHVLTLIENPNNTLITGYALNTFGVDFVPYQLPGAVYGISWAETTHEFTGLSLFSGTADGAETSISVETASGSAQPIQAPGVLPLQDINAPYAYLHASVIDAFYTLRDQVEREIGWNYMDTLENAFLPLTEPPAPDMNHSWLYTGRAIAVNPTPLYGGWLVVAREDFYGQTYWRIYLRARQQDGSEGMPIKTQVWDFTARYTGDTQTYELGGAWQTSPSGYWIDFTEMAARDGWRRVPALNNWRTYFDGTLFNEYVQPGNLDWQSAMQSLYPLEALATATRFPTKTQTPTVTATFTATPRPTQTPTATRIPTGTFTASPSPEE